MDEGSLSDTQRTMVLPLLQETNIRGKPYITVSAKGIVNGLSRYPNDGADFGPDTTKGATAPGQYGSPYTETTGIQEGVSYLSATGGTIILLPAPLGPGYGLDVPVTYNSPYPLRITGEGPRGQQNEGATQTPTYGIVIYPTSKFVTGGSTTYAYGVVTYSLFNFDSPSLNTGYVEFDHINFSGIPPEASGGSVVQANVCGLQFGYSTGNGPVSKYVHDCKVVYIGRFVYSNTVGGPAFMERIHLSELNNYFFLFANETYDDWRVSAVSYFSVLPGVWGLGTNSVIGQSFLTITNCTFESSNNQFYLFGSYMNFVLSASALSGDSQPLVQVHALGTSTPSNVGIDVSDLTIDSTGLSGGNIWQYLAVAQNITLLVASFSGISHRASGTVPQTYLVEGGGVTFGTGSAITFSGSTIEVSPAVVLAEYSSATWPLTVTNVVGYNPQGFAISTPAVPASGTAQPNTNPFPVRIYLLTGGTGTAYTITDRFGNSKTITATLVAGLEVTLDPNASITFTYTGAPTWAWYGT